ncbi:hypothetical protein GJ689_04200 [Rhodoplanes serenus]|uniref:Uncharacterized protein n=1 Tax=Rhodoplanes serenus TaxID=200615 RepID=A0A9X5AQM5_9BRAD|nr:hypothetical protein [Rhodoplanes serenus]MTW15407.1 hypothetical protein [Rhodoplanes serenus]
MPGRTLVSPLRVVEILVIAAAVTAVSTPAFSAKFRVSSGRAAAVTARPAVVVTTGPRTSAPATTTATATTAPSRLASAEPPPARAAASETAADRARDDDPAARRKAWLDFCQPKLAPPDRFGIERWTYAHDGCQFGRVR